jgi:copper chaperone CopZ
VLKADETRNVQTLFNVHMTCDHCIKAVSDSLYSLDGVTKVDANLKDQLVTVEGTGKIAHSSIHR